MIAKRKLLASLLCACLLPVTALAAPPAYITMNDGLPRNVQPTVIVDGSTGTPVSAANPLSVTGASYAYTSKGFQQVASFSTATGFTPPAGATVCFIQAEGNSVRFRTDGTNPTATIGQLLAVGGLLTETASLSTIKFIPTTGNATLDVDCYA